MNTLKLILLSTVISYSINSQIQNPPYPGEIKIINTTSKEASLKVYPVSMIFNNRNFYDLHTRYYDLTEPYTYHYMTGTSLNSGALVNVHTITSESEIYLQHELASQTDGGEAILGFGVYKFEFYLNGQFIDTCIVEYDGAPTPINDLTFFINENVEERSISVEYSWAGTGCPARPITDAARYLKRWEPDWCNNPPQNNRSKNYGDFIYKTDPESYYDILPQDFRQDCGTESNHDQALETLNRTGILSLNLTIDKDIESRTLDNSQANGLLGTPTQIVVSPECYLKINSGKKFTIKEDSYYPYDNTYYTIVTLKQYSNLFLKSSAELKFEKTNEFVCESNSRVLMEQHSKITMNDHSKVFLEKDSRITINNIGAEFRLKSGSYYCNRGAKILSGKLIIEKYVQYCLPDPPARIVNYFQDSASIVLENGAELVIPDSTTYIFEGSETAMICKDSSSIKFGKNSKLVFQDGARISADGCKFTSYDSTQKWDGIYLIDNANDTLKNCTFENAYNGININPPFAAPLVDTHTTIIQNCKFRNTTTGTLLNQVYVNDADGILIDNCTTESNIATGYSTGYVLQYCASNGVVITNNTLNSCGFGITAIQSSPYIARNVITGQTASGTGIYLDNSNGTIEYNRVYNFEKSIEGSYSSPYLLKNTLSDASLQSIALTNNSVPVLRPVVSGSAVRWLGGNNRITGSPEYGAFNFTKDCYPMIDSGYNVIHVTNADYVMAYLDDDYYATLNNWYDNPPITALFNVEGGTLYYDPVFDGTTLPSTDYFELNPLGFDLYDSVFVKNIGDNPGAGSLFVQAYTNESQGNYTSAISLYKEVIAQYSNTEYAPVSLARIFNSLEKNNSSSSAYGQIQAYYTGIKTDTAHTPESREIAEDFVIKAKVKQGNVTEAISDYENIYQMNQNSPKGTHALVNKMCLENMLQGLTDDPNEPVKLNPNKAGLLAFLTRNITSNSQSVLNNNFPSSFRLYQNYPNPFNPQTTIRFDVPKDAMVSVRIYDLLGREVYNVSSYQTAGTHELKFDASNFASGMYFYSVESNGFKETKKMVLLK